MKFNHITSWTKENLTVGEIYETNFNISNYWHNKQRNENQISNEINEIIPMLEQPLKLTGKTFDLTIFTKEIQKSKYYSELLKEYIFEDIRRKEFVEKPSRQDCMFLFPLEVDINDFARNLGYNLNDRTIIEVETLNEEQIHFADLTLLNVNIHNHNEKEEAARLYWSGTNKRNLETEILYRGQFRVTKIIA
jgi:hypothetical protein